MIAIMKVINVDHNSLIDSADHEGCKKIRKSLFYDADNFNKRIQ